MSKEQKQELYNQSVRETRKLGIVSRLTAYLFYRCDLERKESEKVSPRKNKTTA
jgi:hypothetical protein